MFKRKLLPCVLVVVLISLSVGCRRRTGGVLLRYSPQVGTTYPYKLEIVDRSEVTGELQVLSQEENGYRLQFSGTLSHALFSGSLVVSDRHNSRDPGYISLNFPDDPVEPGAEWDGEIPWYFENYYVLDPKEIRLPASYRLLKIEQGENGRYAIIEKNVEADVAVDGLVFHIGQAGVRWDQEGSITRVHPDYDAQGKLQVGDVVLGINEQRAGAAGGLTWLAEKYIQRPKETKSITFTILRDGKEYDIDVEKSIDKLAVVKVYNVKSALRVTFDVDRGILVSAEVRGSQDVAFTSPTTDAFPVVDDYGGFNKFGYLEGRTTYQDHYGNEGVAWILSLVSGEQDARIHYQPTPTLPPPQCPLVPEAGFGDVWRNEQVWPRLGCAAAPAEGVTGTEVYLCDGTHLLWLREQRLFVVIPVRPHAWAIVPDESDLALEMPLMEEPVPRSEPCFPVTGRHSWVVELLSSGTTPVPSARTEETAFSGVIQRFEEGWLLWNGNVCFVLFADGTWTMF